MPANSFISINNIVLTNIGAIDNTIPVNMLLLYTMFLFKPFLV